MTTAPPLSTNTSLGTRIAYVRSGAYVPQVYSSNDGGQTWAAVGAAISATLNSTIADSPGIKSLAFEGTTLTALTTYGVFTHDGQAWQESKGGSGLPVGMSVNALARSGTATLLGTEGGIFVATEQSWAPSNTGLTATSISALAVSGNTIIASTGASGVFRSDNDGQSWTAIASVSNSSGRRLTVKRMAARGNTVLVGTDWGGVFRSNDNGTNWTQIDAGLRLVVFAPDVAFSGPAETDAIYALSWGFVHRLNPDGQGWTVLYRDEAQLRPRSRLAVSGSNVYVATDRYVVRSTDGGVNYAAVTASEQVFASQCIVAHDNQVSFGGEVYNPSGGRETKVFVSTDNGASFTASRSLLFASALVRGNDTWYAATPTDGVYFSKNQGDPDQCGFGYAHHQRAGRKRRNRVGEHQWTGRVRRDQSANPTREFSERLRRELQHPTRVGARFHRFCVRHGAGD